MDKMHRRGNAMVVGLTLTSLLGFSAFSVDIGVIRVGGSQLHAALDAATLSGVGYLDGSNQGIADAIAATLSIASQNHVFADPVSLAVADVQVGEYDGDSRMFTQWFPGDDPGRVNAVRVEHTAPDAAPALGTAAFGVTGYELSASSMAQVPWGAGKASSSSCFLPLAIPDCHLSGLAGGTNPPPMVFSFSPSPTDGVSWGDPFGNPNSSNLRDQLLGQCSSGEITVGDAIHVNEGQHNSATKKVGDILNDRTSLEPGSWSTALYGPIPDQGEWPDDTWEGSDVLSPNYGNTLEGPVALVDAGSDCGDLSFTGSLEMTRVAWAVIYDVDSHGSGKHLKVQIDVKNDHEIWGDIDETATGPNVLGTGAPTLILGG